MSVIIDGSAGVTTNAGGSVNPSTNVEGINYSCRAWVNFNGTGTVAIRGSGNVTSITDNNPGDYTVNFTNALPDANYNVICNSVLASTTSATGSAGPYGTFGAGASTKTTSAVRTLFGNSSTGTGTDTAEANVAIFR